MYDDYFVEQLEPEILRTPLEHLVLSIKSLRLGYVKPFLEKAMNPPDIQSIGNAISLLEDIGALDANENLTPLGEHLAQLPVDPSVGKMIIIGAILGCLDPVLIIASSLGFRDPFVMQIENRNGISKSRGTFCGSNMSDHIAVVKAFQVN